MGVSQSRAAAASSAPSAPHQAARRTSSGGAVAPGNTRGVGCFPRRVPPKTRRATPRATADSSVALSDYSVQSRSREDVSQLLADLKDDGLLDALDAVAADMAARKISFLNPTGGMVSTPFAPHKGGRDEGSILRRSTSQIVGTSRRDVSMGDPRRTARRLTWTDARDIAQALEHVHVFDIRDAMSRCGGIAPAEQRFKPDYSPVRRDDAVPASAFVCDAVPVPSSFSNLSNHHEGVPVFTLDSASRNAARRIAAQLLRHEAIHGDTSGLDVRARIGKMLKRRVTPRVAASVEGAAAAANVGQATPPRSGDTANTGGDKENANVVDGGVCIDRHVTTAGDALLVYLVTAQLRLRRQREALERVRLTKVVEIARLLKQSDVCVSSVPSKRVAAALRTLHRDAIGLIDATAHVSAADACVVFLETALGTQSPNTDTFTHNNTETCLAVRDDVDAAVSPNLATPNLSTTMSSIEEHPTHGDARGSGERKLGKTRRTVSQSPGRYGGIGAPSARENSRHTKDMADAFFEILQLGGLLPRGAR